jgi:hypothetical protein
MSKGARAWGMGNVIITYDMLCRSRPQGVWWCKVRMLWRVHAGVVCVVLSQQWH